MSIRKSSSKGKKSMSAKMYKKPRVVRELPQSELKRKVLVIAKKYKTYEKFEQSKELQRLAFGFETGSTLQIPVNSMVVLHQDFLSKIDSLPNGVLLEDTPPVSISFLRNTYVLTEGYRRYLTALEDGKPLRAIVTIKDSTENKLEHDLYINLKELYETTK